MRPVLAVTLLNRPSEIGRLVDLLESFGEQADLGPEVTFRLTLALDEIVANVIRHGFDDKGDHEIAVEVTVDPDVVTATVEDDGVPYDPRDAPHPDLDAPPDERQPGGLGMHLVRSTMDEVSYRRHDGRNILTVKTSRQGGER
jgi:serine/threonine-protein kinase RsbW